MNIIYKLQSNQQQQQQQKQQQKQKSETQKNPTILVSQVCTVVVALGIK